ISNAACDDLRNLRGRLMSHLNTHRPSFYRGCPKGRVKWFVRLANKLSCDRHLTATADHKIIVARTGTWSEGRVQPRIGFRIAWAETQSRNGRVTQMWSRRRPRSEASQSRAR